MPRNAPAPRAASTVATTAHAPATGHANAARRLSLLLAVLLALVGLAGVAFDAALRMALRPPTARDEASAVCNDLRSRDYDALADEMDPTPDGTSSGHFDRGAFVAGLRAQDAALGPVRTCALSELNGAAGSDSDAVVFTVTVTRTRTPAPLGALVVVRRAARGQWAISRASTFYYAPS